MAKSVPINPSQFAEDGGLLDLSMEEVVALFLDREKRRHKEAKDDENQQEDMVGCRAVPTGLVMALDSGAQSLGLTRSMLTKCLSHQMAMWFDSLPRIKVLCELFDVARYAATEFGYPDLYDGMRPNYEFSSSSPRTISFRTIRWVKNKLSTVSMPLGIPSGYLFAVGLCYSLSRIGDVRFKGTVIKYLSSEVARFSQHVEEQFIRVSGFHDIVRQRAKDDGLDNTIT